MNIWKIYCHSFPNGKKYIGKTCQRLSERFKNGKGYVSCPYMNHAIEKYGWENIEHLLLEDNLTAKEAIEKEQYYIKKYDSFNKDNGYNLTMGGEGNLLYDYDDIIFFWQEGKNISQIAEEIGCCRNTVTHVLRQNGINSDDTVSRKVVKQRESAKKVKQYDLNGNYLSTYNSCGEACQINNWITNSRGAEIRRACNGERPTARGYLWSWDDGTEDKKIIQSQDLKSVHNRRIGQYDKDNNLIHIFNSLTEAAEEVYQDKKRAGDISAVCYGKRKTAKGFIWKFIEEGEI